MTNQDHTRWPGWRPPRRQVWGGTSLPDLAPVNRLLNPCPGCGARRYERCTEWRALMDPDSSRAIKTGTYPVVKDEPCSVRPIKAVDI